MNTDIARPQDVHLAPDEMAATKFLIRYKNPTQDGYRLSLRQWFQFCADHNVELGPAEVAAVRGVSYGRRARAWFGHRSSIQSPLP